MNRTALMIGTLVVGLALAIAGFFLSAPIGPTTEPVYSNPRIDFAPLMFLVGVVLMFGSAVVFELARD